jgi:hypothetical protein
MKKKIQSASLFFVLFVVGSLAVDLVRGDAIDAGPIGLAVPVDQPAAGTYS